MVLAHPTSGGYGGEGGGAAARRRACGFNRRCETRPPAFEVFSKVFVALTNIPEGELLTGFAMRSDPNVVFG